MAERIPSSPLFRGRDEGNWRLGEEKTTLSLFNETWGTWGTERERERGLQKCVTSNLQSLCVPLSVESGEENCRLSRSSVPRPTYGAPNRNVFWNNYYSFISDSKFRLERKKKRLIRLARFEDIKGLVRSGNKWKEKLGEGDLLARKWIKLCFVNRSRLYSRGSCALAVSIKLSCLIRKEGNVIKGVEFFLFSFCCSLRKSWFRCVKI